MGDPPPGGVLPHDAAAALHCGVNTVLDTLAAGVPLVAMPIAFEPPATVAGLAHAGAAQVAPAARALEEVPSSPGRRAAARQRPWRGIATFRATPAALFARTLSSCPRHDAGPGKALPHGATWIGEGTPNPSLARGLPYRAAAPVRSGLPPPGSVRGAALRPSAPHLPRFLREH
ncbi:hypothetical protein [Xanthobacter sediminis]|uniref:hypothetical protein n=1 Tax=Xanthobacter sediminis TaxID=3119926 RepID=UPI003728D691